MRKLEEHFSDLLLPVRLFSAMFLVAIGTLNPIGDRISKASTLAQTDPPPISQLPSSNQSPAAPQSTSPEAQLVEGLLDLLEVEKTNPNTDQDPLVVIQQLMQEASQVLQNGNTLRQARDLQLNVVSHLDSLIGQLQQNQANAGSGQERFKESQQDEVDRQKSMPQSNESVETARNRQSGPIPQSQSGRAKEDDSQPTPASEIGSNEAGEGTGKSPGNAGFGSTPSVRLTKPTDLQQSVWGHLPEQMRSQMQSRMVEEFLPSYRRQLEAYYRTLLEKESRR